MKIYEDITKTVGRTPLVRLNRLAEGMKGAILRLRPRMMKIRDAENFPSIPGHGAAVRRKPHPGTHDGL